MQARVSDYVQLYDGLKCTVLTELDTTKRSTKYLVRFDMSQSNDVIEDFNIVKFIAGPTRELTNNEFGFDPNVLDDSFDAARRIQYEFEDELNNNDEKTANP